MLAIPTTTVTVLTGTTANAYGDTVDASSIVASAVPASLLEQQQQTTRFADRKPQTVQMAQCRLPAGTPVNVGMRVWDEQTQVMWQVDNITQVRNIVSATDIRLALRRAT